MRKHAQTCALKLSRAISSQTPSTLSEKSPRCDALLGFFADDACSQKQDRDTDECADMRLTTSIAISSHIPSLCTERNVGCSCMFLLIMLPHIKQDRDTEIKLHGKRLCPYRSAGHACDRGRCGGAHMTSRSSTLTDSLLARVPTTNTCQAGGGSCMASQHAEREEGRRVSRAAPTMGTASNHSKFPPKIQPEDSASNLPRQAAPPASLINLKGLALAFIPQSLCHPTHVIDAK